MIPGDASKLEVREAKARAEGEQVVCKVMSDQSSHDTFEPASYLLFY